MGEWKNYFVYTKRERWAVIALLIIILGLLAIPHLFEPPLVPATAGLKGPVFEIPRSDSPEIGSGVGGRSTTSYDKPGFRHGPLFPFDPNSSTVAELARLGLSEKAANVIVHYRDKGGRFRKPEDLGKVYSIPRTLYTELLPYVRIEKSSIVPAKGPQGDEGHVVKKERRSSWKTIDINMAAQEEWEALPGIGPTLAKRILTFRSKLGGFVAVEQVRETYGLQDSVFQRLAPFLSCPKPAVKTIDLNTATIEELKAHPYFRGSLAYTIVRYRDQHGRFEAVGDLDKLHSISDSARAKLMPYIAVKNP